MTHNKYGNGRKLYLESDVLGDKERRVDGKRGRVEGAHGIASWVMCLCCVSPLHYCFICSFSFYCYECLHWRYVHLFPTHISSIFFIIIVLTSKRSLYYLNLKCYGNKNGTKQLTYYYYLHYSIINLRRIAGIKQTI